VWLLSLYATSASRTRRESLYPRAKGRHAHTQDGPRLKQVSCAWWYVFAHIGRYIARADGVGRKAEGVGIFYLENDKVNFVSRDLLSTHQQYGLLAQLTPS
jgi:hypothetical protein